MKLNVVVDGMDLENVPSGSKGGLGRCAATGFAFAIALALAAGPAAALEGIDLSKPAEPTAAGECPALIKIKYPFLSCANGQIGQASGDATWENSRQLPLQSEFMEGNGYWGDDLNRD